MKDKKDTKESAFPMRINKYLALKKYSTRRGADEIIKKNQVFINGKLAALGDKVQESDKVEVKFRVKPTAFVYFAYNKLKGTAITGINDAESSPDIFPVSALDKESHGLMIMTNDGRITDRLLSSAYVHEKEYVVTTRNTLRGSFKRKMEEGVKLEDGEIVKCKVKIMDDTRFRVILMGEKRHQLRRMCAALFQEVRYIECVRIMNIMLGNLQEGARREIKGEELKTFLHELGLG